MGENLSVMLYNCLHNIIKQVNPLMIHSYEVDLPAWSSLKLGSNEASAQVSIKHCSYIEDYLYS